MKLYEIISQMDSGKVKKARKFFGSDYFIGEKIIRQFAYLLFDHSIGKNATPDKEKLWEILYPNSSFDDAKFRVLTTKTLNKLIDFFAIETLEETKITKLSLLSDFTRKSGITGLQNRIEKDAKKYLSDDFPKTAKTMTECYHIFSNLLEFDKHLEHKINNPTIKVRDDLLYSNDLLDGIYFLEKIRLRLGIEVLNLPAEHDVNPALLETPNIDQDRISAKNKFVDLYSQGLLLLQSDQFNPGIYNSLLEQLKDIALDFKTEAYDIYTCLNNYLVRLSNRGNNVQEELFQLISFGVTSRLLFLTNDVLEVSVYRNLTLVACRLKKFDWAIDFATKHKKFLEKELQQTAFSFNMARIYINMERFDDVVKVLRDVEYDDITYNLNSKLMLMTSFYELDEYDILDSTIKAFKVFLRRRRNLSKSRKANFLHFCDVVFNLVKAEERKDHKRWYKAQEILQSNAAIPSAWWLKAKMEEVASIIRVPSTLSGS